MRPTSVSTLLSEGLLHQLLAFCPPGIPACGQYIVLLLISFFFILMVYKDQLSQNMLDRFSPNFQQIVDLSVWIMDLTFVF